MIMRNCCCCKVTTGSIILGVLTLISSAIILIPLVGYLLEVDIDGLNVIQSNQKVMEKVLEDGLERHTWTTEAVNDIMSQVRSWLPTIILVCALYAGVTAIFSLLLIIGVSCQVRCLMIPFLILSMLDIILSGTVGIVVVVALFYIQLVYGGVATVVYLLAAVVSLYCWATVLSAYKYLGTSLDQSGYIYSPVTPSKEIPQYYPSAPQYFPMDDYNSASTRR